MIEDTDGKKFGYYLNTEVDDKYDIIIGTDNKSFEFNLQSNKLFLQRMKYEIKRINYGYILFDKSILCFFTLGDIYLFKEFNKKQSCCSENQNNFDYHGIENVLCGKNPYPDGENFPPKRIGVIQMN